MTGYLSMRACVVAIVMASAAPALSENPPGPETPVPSSPVAPESAVTTATHPSDAFFAGGPHQISITLAPEAMESLRSDPRRYVEGTLTEGDRVLRVGVRLKGAAGSFRDVDDRPAFTIDVDRFDRSARFHGLLRFHLNNSVQDPSLLNEWLATELFRAAGVPATRVTHATIVLNDRPLGIYVVKESFDRTFLRRHFTSSEGNLYDGGLLQDLDAELERDAGDGPRDRSDLRAIVEARRAARDASSLDRLESLIDLDAFLRFMAIERFIGHWDGYSTSANNYRLYFDPGRGGRAVFLPHGMDQVFEDPGAPMFDEASPLLASAVIRFDRWRERYQAKAKSLLPIMTDVAALDARIDHIAARLRPTIARLGDEPLREHDERVAGLKERLRQRAEFLTTHLDEPMPAVVAIESEPLLIADWHASPENEEGRPPILLTEVDGIRRIDFGQRRDHVAVAAWRGSMLCGRGRYILSCEVKITDLAVDPDDRGVSLVLNTGERSDILRTNGDWRRLEVSFEVTEDRRRIDYAFEAIGRAGAIELRGASLTR